MQGGTIQMYVDYRDLTKDENFWKNENDITKFAMLHLKELKKVQPYDFHKLSPQTYDIRNNEQDNKADNGGPKSEAPAKKATSNVQ
jgi:hypothetical protein